MTDMESMSKDELEKLQISKENEHQLCMESLSTVEIQDLEYAKQIAEISLKRKNLAMAITQGRYNIRRISSELKNIKTMIYRRLSGL